MYIENGDYIYLFGHGAKQLPKFRMQAGQTYDLTTEWNFSDPNTARDWSVVAYGTEGDISVKLDGYESDTLPLITRDSTSTGSTTGGNDTAGDNDTTDYDDTTGGDGTTDDDDTTDGYVIESDPVFDDFVDWVSIYDVDFGQG
jgi:hypothetical protein